MAAAERLETAEHVAASEILRDTEPMAAAKGLEAAEPAVEISADGPGTLMCSPTAAGSTEPPVCFTGI